MNLIGLHFKLRKAFLGLFRKPAETREERVVRLCGEYLRLALVDLVMTELEKHPLTPEEIAYLADENL